MLGLQVSRSGEGVSGILARLQSGHGLSSWMRCWYRGIRPSEPAVLIASIPEDQPGPSSAVGDQEEEQEEEEEEAYSLIYLFNPILLLKTKPLFK